MNQADQTPGCEICRNVKWLRVNRSSAIIEDFGRTLKFGIEPRDAKFCYECGRKLPETGELGLKIVYHKEATHD